MIKMTHQKAAELVSSYIPCPAATGTKDDELEFYAEIQEAYSMFLNALKENSIMKAKLDMIEDVMKDGSLSVGDTYGIISEILNGNFEYYNNLKNEYE